MINLPEQTLAHTLRSSRLSAGLTQEGLAERSGISARTISDVERGLRSKVYPTTARCLASALGLGEAERRVFLSSFRSQGEFAEPASRHGLPTPPTPLIGRSHETQVITDAVVGNDHRLVTLTGPGGVGKTRVALEAARLSLSHFPDGVFFVSLGELNSASLVPIAMARALGVVEAGGDLETSITRRLAEGRYLIILDTFEHVLGAAAVVHSLLLKCPETSFLVTSRTALRLRAEHEFHILPLELPPARANDSERPLSDWAATSLFLQRALAVKPRLKLDPDSSRLIVEICRRLEGLPLAIELAASRVRHLPLELLRDQLEHRLELLVRGGVDFPPRQRTMRDTLAWSHDLLDRKEQVLFRRLSVFAGGWDLEAVEPVCQLEDAALDTLSGLLDKSLIHWSGDGPAARYDMLDVVREYGEDRLASAGERHELAGRHARYYLDLAERAEDRLVTSDQTHSITMLDAEHNNLRKALGWLIERRETEPALKFVVALWRYWRHTGQLTEGRRWCESAISLPGDCPVSLRAKAYWGTAALAFPQGDYKRMSELASSSLAFAMQSGEPMDLRNAHTMVGLVALVEGRYAGGVGPLQKALDLCRNLGQTWQLATSYLNLGVAMLHSARLENAETVLQEGLRIYSQLGDETFAARARVLLSHVALARRNNAEAEELARTALSAFATASERQGTAEALVTMGAIKAAAGDRECAAELSGAAAAVRDTIAARPAPFDDAIPGRFLTEARKAGDAAWEVAFSRGRGLSPAAAISKALD